MLELVIDARKADLGGGFKVDRVLPFRKRRMVGPFIFLDHAGPVTLSPQQLRGADVKPHPHIGLSTVSYLFGGQSPIATVWVSSRSSARARSIG
jgi:redox-sensitive bicupin YhaK (pirin superfamily)